MPALNVKKFKELKEKHNYTNKQMANLLGYRGGDNSIWLIENGKRGMGYKKIVLLSEIFNCDPQDLIETKKYKQKDVILHK